MFHNERVLLRGDCPKSALFVWAGSRHDGLVAATSCSFLLNLREVCVVVLHSLSCDDDNVHCRWWVSARLTDVVEDVHE